MHRFETWAPFAKSLSVSVNGVAHRMDGPNPNGWWQRDVEDATPGTDYGFLIDDDPACYPDPRSQWQPNGVHKSSRVYDQPAFGWTDGGFQSIPLAGGIIYEMHIGTFTPEGTFDAAIVRLDYLVDLGITHVELMPVAAFEGQHGWGYDGVALYAVHEPYGGPDGLKRFVNAAHEKGLAVLLDVVYNHFGPSGNYTGKFGPYVVDSHHTPWGGAVNLEDAGSTRFVVFSWITHSCGCATITSMDCASTPCMHSWTGRQSISSSNSPSRSNGSRQVWRAGLF